MAASRLEAERSSRQRDIYHHPAMGGGVVYELVDSHGVVQMECRVPAELANRRTVRWLRTVLDALDPVAPPLKIVS
jgi:hypothetical protein